MSGLLLLLLLIAGAAAVSNDEARAAVRAEEAVRCWPVDLQQLVNTTIQDVAPPPAAGIARLGRFFALMAAHMSALRPLCGAYALTTVTVTRQWRRADAVGVVEPAPTREWQSYCEQTLSAATQSPGAAPALIACMREGAVRALGSRGAASVRGKK